MIYSPDCATVPTCHVTPPHSTHKTKTVQSGDIVSADLPNIQKPYAQKLYFSLASAAGMWYLTRCFA